MNKGTVEVKFQDGTAIKIKGSADFVAAVTTSILEVGKGKSGEHIQLAQIKESSQAGKLAHSDYVEKDELEAPADHPPRNQSSSMDQKLCWSLKEAGKRCGVSYITLYRAACRGDLKIMKGFGRMMVSESELSRFVANLTEYLPRKRTARRESAEQ
jgi:hypothetical protein